MSAAIELIDVTKRYKDFAIENFNLKVPQGYITGFVGPNGAGKSTVIRLIMDVVKPDSGEIRLFGRPNRHADLRREIGFVYDDLYMYRDFTIMKLRSLMAPLYPNWDDNLYQKYLGKFGLPENKKLKTFSQGMRMKASLLFCLSHRPKLIIMDEPTAGLDPIVRRELLEELQELMIRDERTIFFSTHITEDLDRIADQIAFIYDGKLMLNERMDHIRDNYFVVRGPVRELGRDLKTMLLGWRETPHGFSGLICGGHELFVELPEFRLEPASLDDIMYFMTRKEAA